MPNTSLPPAFWDKERDRLLAVLAPKLEERALAGLGIGADKLARLGIAFDPDLANAEAMRWAGRYTDDLLNLVGTTNERVVGDIIADWTGRPGATLGELVAKLKEALDYNVSRADSIAVTETTRATAQGNILAFTEAGAQPPPMWTDRTGTRPFGPTLHPRCRCDTAMVRYKDIWLIVWYTNRDEMVCRRPSDTPWGVVNGCRALHGVCISQGEFLGRKVV